MRPHTPTSELHIRGQKFWSLKAIHEIPESVTRTKWVFRCDCGDTVTLGIADVIAGNIKDCGCGISKAPAAKRRKLKPPKAEPVDPDMLKDGCKYNPYVVCLKRKCKGCGWNTGKEGKAGAATKQKRSPRA